MLLLKDQDLGILWRQNSLNNLKGYAYFLCIINLTNGFKENVMKKRLGRPPHQDPPKVIMLSLPTSVYEACKVVQEHKGVTVQEYIRRALRMALEGNKTI